MTRSAAATVVILVASAMRVAAQGWSADVSAGRHVYDPVSASIRTSNVIGTLRYDTPTGTWVYGAGAVPANDDGTHWGAGGIGGRLVAAAPASGRMRVGADLGAHGFSFIDGVVNQTGAGGTFEAMPFARLAIGTGFVEGRGGWRGQTLSFAGFRENRDVWETGARGGYGTTFSAQGDLRWVHAVEGTFPFIGGTVAYQRSHVGMWGHTGKWLATDLRDAVWAVGTSVSLSVRTSVWGSIRQEAPDPLYWNSTRRTWSLGITQRLGRIPLPLIPISASPTGAVVIRLPAGDAPAGTVSIAGDFNNWQPAPMQREGNDWVVRLPLAPGVYHYSFRSASGEWFVPASTPGRRDDGMGGHQAVLVVS